MNYKITHICEPIYDLKWKSGTVIGIYSSCFNVLTDTNQLITFFKKTNKFSTRALVTDIESPIPLQCLSEGAKAFCNGKSITVGDLVFDLTGAEKIVTNYPPVKATAEYTKNISLFEDILKRNCKKSPIFENGIIKEKAEKGFKILKTDLVAGFESLIGLGIGLTPSCDDMLAGMSAWFHLTDTGHEFNKALAEFLDKKGDLVTTTVSKNLLLDSAKGHINEIVYNVINSILTNKGDIEKYTLQLIGYGSSSGTETCAGILNGYNFIKEKELIKWL